jgi:uncharacterized protein (DUF1015 family)
VPQIRPFAAVQYGRQLGSDWSNLVAPPFDVLDERTKAALQARDPHNIVTVDLPYLPPKAVGPDEVYAAADATLKGWLKAGILVKPNRQAIYPYTQSFPHNGLMHHRKGFFAVVKVSPFGQGQVVPHEQTYREAIEDRLKLTRATQCQLSPIFGLYSDTRHEVTKLLYENLGRPEHTATLDGVRNDLWSVTDADVERQVMDFVGRKPIYIADGHHRYTTAVAYLQELEAKHGGPLPPTHPANYCMFCLVAMQDEGLLVLPTHRLIGNVESFDVAALTAAVAGTFDVVELDVPPQAVAHWTDVTLPQLPAHTFGLYDGRGRKLYQLTCKNPDVLKAVEPTHSDAWRRLDVAILQRYLLDQVIEPKFAGGKTVTRTYVSDASEVVPRTDGKTSQIALLLKATPLGALEQLAVHHEVMPAKSTYFYPKLATGMCIHALQP